MPSVPLVSAASELFSAEEIAAAARVDVSVVRDLMAGGRTIAFRGYVAPGEAAVLVRRLATDGVPEAADRAALTFVAARPRRTALPLALSGLAHVALVLLLAVIAVTGLGTPAQRPDLASPRTPARLVYLISPGPGGGGGGGGMAMPAPPPAPRVKPPAPRRTRVRSPVIRARVPPPPRRPPPRPAPPVRPLMVPAPTPVDIPRAAPPAAVTAPVVTAAADPVTTPGLVGSTTTAESAGVGHQGGVGSGVGSGMGEGQGDGLGEGSGGGTGGGPLRAGSGIEPPAVVREVRPTYTDEARRRAIEGDVDLEIVVEADGRVGNVRVVRGLGAGLNDRAIAAVRQWRFHPARRRGAPVAVVVNVSVGFSLR